jgi:hypothetical protein
MGEDKISKVLNGDALLPLFAHDDFPGQKGISLSRNPNFDMNLYTTAFLHPVRLTLDQALLTRHHKIYPVDADYMVRNRQGFNSHDRPLDRLKTRLEHTMAEEYVVGAIRPLHKFVTAIQFDNGYLEVTDNYAGAGEADLNKYFQYKLAKNLAIYRAVYDFATKWRIRLTVEDSAMWRRFIQDANLKQY